MRVVLAALNAKYIHSNLAVYDLEAYARKRIDDSTSIIIKEYTINNNMDLILQDLYKQRADKIAFSCYIWNISEIKILARELKKVSPNLEIWGGGPEVSYDSERFLAENDSFDGIMCGEGEKTFAAILQLWNKNADKSEFANINGITYRDKKNQIMVNRPVCPMDLDEVPFIYEDLEKFRNKILYYETSRGCPFSCSYCLSSIDKRVRFRSFELVKKELQFFLDNKVKQVKFVDRTFNCNREHAMKIWNYIAENDNGITNFHFEISADIICDEEIEILKKMRPGLIQLEIGLQSTNSTTIKEIRRKMNIEKVSSNMSKIRNFKNIHQHLDLIAGLPYEDLQTFIVSFNDAYGMQPDQLQLGFLKVLKGSHMNDMRKEYEIKYQSSQPYEVLSTKWLSYDDILLLKQVEEMVEVYYNSAQFSYSIKYLEQFFETPFKMYEMLGQYYEENDLYGIGFKREKRYEVINKFVLENFNTDNKEFMYTIFNELLTLDFYLRDNVKIRPAWSQNEMIDKIMYQNFFKKGYTDEIDLRNDQYDSKTASRKMHIEFISKNTVKYLNNNYNSLYKECDGYFLFDYEKRNPLSGDATITFLSYL